MTYLRLLNLNSNYSCFWVWMWWWLIMWPENATISLTGINKVDTQNANINLFIPNNNMHTGWPDHSGQPLRMSVYTCIRIASPHASQVITLDRLSRPCSFQLAQTKCFVVFNWRLNSSTQHVWTNGCLYNICWIAEMYRNVPKLNIVNAVISIKKFVDIYTSSRTHMFKMNVIWEEEVSLHMAIQVMFSV